MNKPTLLPNIIAHYLAWVWFASLKFAEILSAVYNVYRYKFNLKSMNKIVPTMEYIPLKNPMYMLMMMMVIIITFHNIKRTFYTRTQDNI